MTLTPQIQGSFTPDLFLSVGQSQVGTFNVTHHTEDDVDNIPVTRSWCEYHRVGNIVNMCFALDFTIDELDTGTYSASQCVLNMGGFPIDILPGRFKKTAQGVEYHDETTYGTGTGSFFLSPEVGTVLPNLNADVGTFVTVVTPTLQANRWQGIVSDGANESAIILKANHLTEGNRYYFRGNATYYTNKEVS